MTAKTCKQIGTILEELANQYPDLRLGQMIVMIATLAGDQQAREVYDLEDDEFIRVAREHLKQRSTAVAS